jgi:enamine deaminase RidA (YjgF/YER057c/UK114 family)
MGVEDLVKLTVYITRQSDLADYRAVRDAALAGAQPAATLVVVAGLALPEWLVEVEAIAAKA